MSRKWYFGDTPDEYSAHLHDATRMQPAIVASQYLASDGYRTNSVTGAGFACPVCKSAWLPYYGDKQPQPPQCDGVFVWREDSDEPREDQHYPPAKFKRWSEQ